jgi:5-methylthioadenosine/S-adenosylhomocysteine deaminase
MVFDLAIRADYLLSMNAQRPVVERDQLLGIVGSKITYIGVWNEQQDLQTKRFIHAQNQVVMPGLINGHGHFAMTLFRGLADDLPLFEWLNKYIFPLEAKAVNPEMVSLGTELAALEMIQSGTTTALDMYYFETDVARVCDRVGLRALVGESFINFPVPDNPNLDGSNFKLLDALVEEFKGHERITPLAAPHAPYTCSDELLKKVRDVALKKGIGITIHVSETKGEVEGSLKDYKKTPAQRLYDLGLFDAPTIIAHGVHLTSDEITLLKSKNTSVVYNPESNMKLGAGAAPITELRAKGVATGIGTDSAASNNDLSLFKEMDMGAKLQKLIRADNTAMTALQALKMATIGGAEALGLASQIGSLEVGKLADVIAIDLNRPHFWPVNDLASHLVYAANGSEVLTVVCHGKLLVDQGQCLTIDRDRLRARVEKFRSTTLATHVSP